MAALRMDWYSLISIHKPSYRAILSECLMILDHLNREVELWTFEIISQQGFNSLFSDMSIWYRCIQDVEIKFTSAINKIGIFDNSVANVNLLSYHFYVTKGLSTFVDVYKPFSIAKIIGFHTIKNQFIIRYLCWFNTFLYHLFTANLLISLCPQLLPLFCLHWHKFLRHFTSHLWCGLWWKHVWLNQNL